MSRRIAVAIALVVVLSAAAAAQTAAVTSTNGSNNEFRAGERLDELYVDGGAAVLAQVEGFDSGVSSEVSISDDGEYGVQSSVARVGSQAMHYDDSAGSSSISLLQWSPAAGAYDEASVWIRDEALGQTSDDLPSMSFLDQGGNIVAEIELRGEGGSGSLYYQDGSGTLVDSGIDVPEGSWVRVELANIDYGANEYGLRVYDESGSIINLVGGIEFADGTAASSLLALRVSADEGAGDFYVDELAFSGGPAAQEGQYVGATHDVSRATEAFVDVALTDAHADYAIEYGGPGNWQDAASGTLSSTGNHSIDISGHEDATQWRTSVTLVNETTAATTAEIDAEGILADARSPTISNPTPTGSADLSEDSVTLSADVTDGDFSLPQGDTVTATWYVNGSQVDQTQVTSNGTISTTVGGLSGGEHEWFVEAVDDDGLSTRSPSAGAHTFSSPNTLYIYQETNPEQLVTSTGDAVEISLYGTGDTVATRETSDGTVNLTGLDPDQEYVVSANIDGYVSRRIILTSLYEQQEIYLLDDAATSVDVFYELDDRTGEFPPSETRLRLQRPITKDFDDDGEDETRYQTILGDTFGAINEFAATVQPDTRYRLIVENADGDRRDLGTHTVSSGGLQTIPIGQVSVGGETEVGTSFGASVSDGPDHIQFAYRDEQDATTALTYRIERDDGSVMTPNTTVTGQFGTLQRTIVLPPGEDDGESYTVSYWASRDDQPDVSGERLIGGVPTIADDIGVDPVLLEMGGWVMIVGSMGFVVIYDDRLAALSGVVIGGALSWFGIVSIPVVGIGIAGAIAVMYLIGREGINR